MNRLNVNIDKIKNRKRKKNCNKYVEYNPQNIENILQKFNELNQYITNLENSLKTAENKNQAYEDILLKFEKFFKEEIMLYSLHKTNISVLNENVNENEIFIHEIQQQVQSFIDSEAIQNIKEEKITSFKRILSRFFHQNEIYKSRTQQKLSELNETIEHKKRLLERMQNEIKSWYNNENTSFSLPERISIKQACGY